MPTSETYVEFVSTRMFIQRKDRIYLIEVYAKGVDDDLTRAEENGLREVAKMLQGEK